MGVGTASAVAEERIQLSPLGVVTALPGEARILAGRRCAPKASLTLPNNVNLRLSGMGPDAATVAAQALVESGSRALVSWGSAGGLTEQMPAGTLIVPTHIVTEKGEDHTVDAQWRARLSEALGNRCTSAALCSSTQPVSSVEAKRLLHQHTQAVAVDMESAAVAAVAQRHGLPFLVVRAIADTVDIAIPDAAMQALSQAGKLQPMPMLTSLLKHPGQISVLLELARCFRLAQASLQNVVAIVGPRLSAE